MIIWRIGRLVEQIGRQPLSSRELLPYAIASAILAALAFVVADWLRPWDRDDFEAVVDSVTTLLAGVISGLGIWACYRANGGKSGAELADRLLAIGFVLFVRFIVISALAFVIWAYAAVSLNWGFRPAFEELDLLFVGVVILFWFRLHGHIESVARVRGGPSTERKS
jgi:hypothetical protein